MVNAELNYNPFLMTTEVQFNGHAPRINSLVEKYDKKMLQDWIRLIPFIFRDEMNGYDFELNFSGTCLDLEELKASFRAAGVTEEQVRIFHKNVLNGRLQKIQDIEELLRWLAENRNRKFDYEAFRHEHEEWLEGSYPYIILHGNAQSSPTLEQMQVSMEMIGAIEELNATTLTNIPILYCIDRSTLPQLSGELNRLLAREDIAPEQVFFHIDPALKGEQVERTLRDLGMKEPQVIRTVDDPMVLKYLEIYPLGEYICEMIRAFRSATDRLAEELRLENEAAAVANREIYAELDSREYELAGLRNALQRFEQRDNIDEIESIRQIQRNLMEKIFTWRVRKTKITHEEEASQAAGELDLDIQRYYSAYIDQVREELEKLGSAICAGYREWYEAAGLEPEYAPMVGPLDTVTKEELPSCYVAVMKLRHEQWVTPKDDFIGKFFKAPANEPKEPVLEKTWYYNEWRDYVSGQVESRAEKAPEEAHQILCRYSDALAEAYIGQLKRMIEEKTAAKNEVASKLSEDLQLLQTDNDWFGVFVATLEGIERN